MGPTPLMKSLTQLAHHAVSQILRTGDIAIDLTIGNGFDTLFMSKCVGLLGRVYGFDVQSAAIQATQTLLNQHSQFSNVSLIHESHSQWKNFIPIETKYQIATVMMNLGYLPGSDKALVTQANSTLAAMDIALEWLKPGGMLSIIAYTGHPGGQLEADSVQAQLQLLDSNQFAIFCEPVLPADGAPVLHLVYKNEMNSGGTSMLDYS